MLRDVTDQRIAKWTKWCEGTIKNEVVTMHLHRETWQEIGRIIDEHGSLPDSYFWEYHRDIYAVTQAVAVRRQADIHRDAASLGRLVLEISEDAKRISRDFWTGLWDTSDTFDLRHAERAWSSQYAGKAGDHLDPAIPAGDLDQLRAAAAGVKTYVDQHLAHSDTNAARASDTLTLKDVHDAIDVIGHQFKKYSNLLTAASWVSLVPVIQHDWLAPFRQPWIRVSRFS
jgi:hypothetical protein